MTEQEFVIQKSDWPRGEFGVIDWETVFESPTDGLIPLIETADREHKVVACTRTVIESLFALESDESLRERFLEDITAISDTDGSGSEGPGKQALAAMDLLRQVKLDRVERAEAYIRKKKAEIREAKSSQNDEEPAEKKAEVPADPLSIALGNFIDKRLAAVRCYNAEAIEQSLPFLVSPVFSKHLKQVVLDYVGPAMSDRMRGLVLQAEQKPEDARVAFILGELENRKQRSTAWEVWKDVWQMLTQQSDIPDEPEKGRKSGKLSGLLGKKSQKKGFRKEMTHEEWEIISAQIQSANERAEMVWNKITEPSQDYQAPTDQDAELLMNLFGRTPEALKKQTEAIYQIADQDVNRGKVFSNYQQGKDIDGPLLCACLSKPDRFLHGDILKDFLRGFPERMRKDRFPLISRYLAEYI